MTEQDAVTIAQLDGHHALTRIERARGPDDIVAIVDAFLIYRIEGMDNGQAANPAREALRYGVPEPTLPRRIQSHVQTALQIIAGLPTPGPATLPHEDIRAMLAWCCGRDGVGPGFLTVVFHNLQDRDTPEAQRDLITFGAQILTGLENGDRLLFDRIAGELGEGVQSWIQGCILEAKWAALAHDGESARNRAVECRRSARLLLARHRRARRAFYDDVQESPAPPRHGSLFGG